MRSLPFLLALAAIGCATSSSRPDSDSDTGAAIRAAAGDAVRIDWIKEDEGAVRVRGNATSPENVAVFRKELEGMLVTPRGIGRTVERSDDSVTVRLADSTSASFAPGEVRQLCTSLDQKRGEQFSFLNKPAIYNFELICSQQRLREGSGCGQTAQCAEGLLCCEQPSGIQKPSGHSTCVKPCAAGTRFCTDGCYYPPVP